MAIPVNQPHPQAPGRPGGDGFSDIRILRLYAPLVFVVIFVPRFGFGLGYHAYRRLPGLHHHVV